MMMAAVAAAKDWRQWVRGLVGAVINSAATAVTMVIVAPDDFNLSTGLSKLGTVMLVQAIVGAALYLKNHPLPGDDEGGE